VSVIGLIKVDLEFSFSILGLFQTWNSNKPGFEKLNSKSELVFENLNSRSELALRKKFKIWVLLLSFVENQRVTICNC
jgi:hypothetical protein